MKFSPLIWATPALAAVLPHVPTAGELLEAVDQVLFPADHDSSIFSITEGFNEQLGGWGGICSLVATPEGQDDTDNIERLFQRCGKNSIVTLPSERYNITRPLTLHLENMYVSIKGWLSFSSDNIDSWIEKSYVFPFQDQRLAFIIEGHDFVIDGHGTGGIDGNGQAWYDWAEGVGNKHGRPIAMTLKGVRNGVVNGFQIIQPQFWAHLVWDSANIVYDKCYVNATNFNTKALTWAHSGLQNTDGINTYRSRNVAVSHFVYQGGDDCIALKPNSTEIALNDIRCHGGAGIAFGSIGQYAGTTDIIRNVAMSNLHLSPSSQDQLYHGVYFKSWVGVEVGKPPNGGGGGAGWCKNVSISHVHVDDAIHPIALTSSLTYLEDEHGKYKDTSVFKWSHINFTDFSGTSRGNRVVWMDCSAAMPCHKFNFTHINIVPGRQDNPDIGYVCNNVHKVVGDMPDCHPSDSDEETDAGGTV